MAPRMVRRSDVAPTGARCGPRTGPPGHAAPRSRRCRCEPAGRRRVAAAEAGTRRMPWSPTRPSRSPGTAPAPGGRTTPTVRSQDSAAAAGSGTASSRPTRRAVPPNGWTNRARARRASSSHSGPAQLVLDEERRLARAEDGREGALPGHDGAVRPGSRRRGWPRRSASRPPAAPATSRRTPSVARAKVTSPGAPASRARITAAPMGCVRARRPVPGADQLQVGVAEEDEPVVGAAVVAPAAGRGQPERLLQRGRGGVRVRDGDDEVVDPEQHRTMVAAGRVPAWVP